jgi:hypothetical protein
MQILGKLLLLIFVGCYISTAYGKQKTVKDNVVEQATHIKDTVVEQATHFKDNVVDTVSDGVTTGAKFAAEGVKVASDAAKTAG